MNLYVAFLLFWRWTKALTLSPLTMRWCFTSIAWLCWSILNTEITLWNGRVWNTIFTSNGIIWMRTLTKRVDPFDRHSVIRSRWIGWTIHDGIWCLVWFLATNQCSDSRWTILIACQCKKVICRWKSYTHSLIMALSCSWQISVWNQFSTSYRSHYSWAHITS